MTIYEKMCEEGVSTLAEYMCLSIGEGGDVYYTINGEFVYLKEEKDIILKDIDNDILFLDEEIIQIIDEPEINVKIEEGETVYGIC